MFVNTRKLSRASCPQLGERLGEDQVAAHHGSLSRERRQRVEHRLRAGDLRALVATASLELGIDVGPVELVCQIGSPHSIATFLQRVGPGEPPPHRCPAGIMYPTTRDELVECAALLPRSSAGASMPFIRPTSPSTSWPSRSWPRPPARGEEGMPEAELFELVTPGLAVPGAHRRNSRRSSIWCPSASRPGADGAWPISTATGSMAGSAAAEGPASPRLTSGGAIPETGDYRVLMEPGDVFVGTVNEDFAIESFQGDVFLLGTHPWQIVQVTNGVLRVRDATGRHPTIPFWVGERRAAPTSFPKRCHGCEARSRNGSMPAGGRPRSR